MTRPRSLLRAAAFACMMLACASPLGCRAKEDALPERRTAKYEVRALIVSLPAPDDPVKEIQARHESIPDFRANILQPPEGMRTMTMPFPVGEGLSLEGVEPGAKVLLTFEVEYDPDTGMIRGHRAIALAPLDPATELDFGAPPASGR